MSTFYSAAITVLAGVVLQNVLFARAFSADASFLSTKTYRDVLKLDLVTTVVTLVMAVLVWMARRLMSGLSAWGVIRWPVYFACLFIGYVFLRFIIIYTQKDSSIEKEFEFLIMRVSFNGIAFGIVLIAAANFSSFALMMLYTLGCCIGLMGAHMIIRAGQERIELSNVPRAFRGVPVLMIYIGILSLAIYGLIGHQLPT